MKVGLIEYGHCINVRVDERGLYISPTLMFRPFHPPVRIPWRAIHAEPIQSKWTRFRWKLHVDEARVAITIGDPLYRKIQTYLESR
jgi:hypothetical protein